MSLCQTCGWYRIRHSYVGNCANPRNAEVKFVGGGGEYNSSEQCLVTPRVQANFSCPWHEEFKAVKPSPVATIVELPRTPDLKPYQSTPWSIGED